MHFTYMAATASVEKCAVQQLAWKYSGEQFCMPTASLENTTASLEKVRP